MDFFEHRASLGEGMGRQLIHDIHAENEVEATMTRLAARVPAPDRNRVDVLASAPGSRKSRRNVMR